MAEINPNIYVSTRDINEAQEQVEDVRNKWLKNAPPWRAPIETRESLFRTSAPGLSDKSTQRGSTYVGSGQGDQRGDDQDQDASPSEEQLINLALILRRPLLVEGPPGVGKSTLAYHIAWNLGLGEPLRWEINSRTTLKDGLYEYRAVEHLRDIQKADGDATRCPTSKYITLGPLGTAFVPSELPRVLLIDELDKAQFDLPNDLLHILEEAQFKVKELVSEDTSEVYPFDYEKQINENDGSDSGLIKMEKGEVTTHHHPIVVITSNGDREFPPAFLRRCIRLKLRLPSKDQLRGILRAQFHKGDRPVIQDSDEIERVIDAVLDKTSGLELSTDQHIQRLFAEVVFGVEPWITDFATQRDHM